MGIEFDKSEKRLTRFFSSEEDLMIMVSAFLTSSLIHCFTFLFSTNDENLLNFCKLYVLLKCI